MKKRPELRFSYRNDNPENFDKLRETVRNYFECEDLDFIEKYANAFAEIYYSAVVLAPMRCLSWNKAYGEDAQEEIENALTDAFWNHLGMPNVLITSGCRSSVFAKIEEYEQRVKKYERDIEERRQELIELKHDIELGFFSPNEDELASIEREFAEYGLV